MKGQVVYHPKYGRGIAADPRKSGLEYQVQFDNGITCWVRTDTLEISEMPSRSAVVRQTDREKPANFIERRVIEALRLGIVPDEGLQLFTIGRESELSVLRTWLDTPNKPGQLIIGAYGTGKTHLLNHFRSLALDAGYAVSLVEMDSQETPFSKPKRVYSEIVRNLKWREGNRELGFRELVERGLTTGLLHDHEYFKHLRRVSDERLWAWINGSDGSIRPSSVDATRHPLPALYDYTTAANIYCYLLSGLGWLSCSPVLGLRGLLVLFDESEALYAARGQLAVDRSVNFLDALIGTAYGRGDLLRPAYQTEFAYAGHASHIPFLYQRPSGLKLVFAFTSEVHLGVSHELSDLPDLSLGSVESQHLLAVLSRLLELYRIAYGERFKEFAPGTFVELMSKCQLTNTRATVKGAIEALDICRFGTYTLGEDR